MKNEKTLSGLAYMFLGAAVLIGGSSVQDQVNRLTSDPDAQMVKAMYVSLLNQTVQAKTEFLAQNTPAIATEFDSAVAAHVTTVAEARPVVSGAERVEVVVPALPQIEVKVAELPAYLAPAQANRLKLQMIRMQAKREAREALRSLPTEFRFVHFPAPPAAPAAAPRMDRQRVIVVNTPTQDIAACTESERKAEVEAETEL
jgi:hypothetical protein